MLVITAPRCPHCRHFVFLDLLNCPGCGADVAFDIVTRQFAGLRDGKAVIDDVARYACSNRTWGCNWLVREDAPSGLCFSCRLTRTRPASDDTVAMEKFAITERAKRRLVLQLRDLGLPIVPWDVAPGGLGFDLISSLAVGHPVTIGHANGIITIDLAENLDDRREALRVKLGEPYRTMLGHLRHEVGHYYEFVLVGEDEISACRDLFGDERASYSDAISRHYSVGAPEGWEESFISEYATMHPWEDFAETFAHYLHITGTLQTASAIGMRLDASRTNMRDTEVVPLESYADEPIQRVLADWGWMSDAFNRVNRAMGQSDLYPFELTPEVRRKLGYVHDLVTHSAIGIDEQIARGVPSRTD